MAKLYGEIDAKTLLTLDKSFARANGQPLDASEVYYSKTAAEEYAATAQAYIGQKIVVIENGVVTHYSVEDTAGTLKELGSKPVADGTTVAIGEDGKITLANITDVEAKGTYNAVLVDGKLTWVKPSSTTVEGLNDLITALTTRVDGHDDEIEALQEAVGVASKPESAEGADDAVAATGLHKAIEDEVARAKAAEEALDAKVDAIDFVDQSEMEGYVAGLNLATKEELTAAQNALPVKGVAAGDKVLSVSAEGQLLAATISMSYDEDAKAIKLYGIDNAELGSVDATPFIKDGMLEDVSYDPANNTLTFKWNTASGLTEDTVILSDIIEPYTAGNGLDLSGNEFAIALDSESEEFLSVGENGLKLAGVQAAINAAKQAAIEDAAGKYATTSALTAVSNVADAAVTPEEMSEFVEGKGYATSAYVGAIPEGYTQNNIVAYINKKAEETLSQATGGTGESAAEVKAQLDTYKSENDAKVNANTTAVADLKEKLDTVEENAEVNIIESVKVNGNALTPDENRAVNISVPVSFSDLNDNSGFDARITAAQNRADAAHTLAGEAKAAAEQAQSEVDDLETIVGGHTTKLATLDDHSARIIALENADTAHAAEYTALSNIVSGHTTDIAGKASQEALNGALADIAKHTTAINTINETTIPGLEEAIGKKADGAATTAALNKKADADKVYTKDEINALTGEVPADKTLVQMIADAKSEATYDDSAIKALISTNTESINKLNGAVDVVGSVKYEAAAAAKAEVALLVGEAPDALDTLEEIAKWISTDDSGATSLVNRVAANEQAISAINNAESGILAQAKEEIEAAESRLTAAINAIPAASAETLGLVKVDNKTIQANEGVISVKEVSTDQLVQGINELVLNGGSATEGSN